MISLDASFDTSGGADGVPLALINKGDCPSLNGVRFWYDQNRTRTYAYGGEWSQLHPWLGPATVPPNDLWSYLPLDPGPGGSWQKIDTTSNGGWQHMSRVAGGGVAAGDGVGYGLGGYTSSWTDRSNSDLGGIYKPASGLKIWNITSNTCSTNSALGYGDNGTFTLGGLIHADNWGPEGLLFAFGGQTSTTLDTFVDGEEYRDMRNISIFEPVAGRWYYQTATGDVPTVRDSFCTVGTTQEAFGNGTYEIFMYGGRYGSSSDNQVQDEVYVLSLPAFQWFKADYLPTDNRVLHTCHAVGRQLLSVGGVSPSAASFQVSIGEEDSFVQGLKVFDMTDLQWTNKWDAATPAYEPPAVVTSFYESIASSGPSQWDMPELEAIFNGTATFGTQISNDGSADDPGKTNIGAIVGGVVGGVAGIAVLAVSIYNLMRKRNRKARTPGDGMELVEESGTRSKVAEAASGTGIHEVESPPAEMLAKIHHFGSLHQKRGPKMLMTRRSCLDGRMRWSGLCLRVEAVITSGVYVRTPMPR